jgi:hypothetical protein
MSRDINATAALYLYALFVGSSYLIGYWLPFGLNILAFADLTDIIKASVIPIIPAIGLLLTYSALDGLNSISKKQHDEYIVEGGFFKYYMKFLVIYGYVITILLAGNFAYTIIIEPGIQKLKGAFPLASLILFCYLIYGNRHLLSLDVKSRVFVISLLCFLPTAAFTTGNRDGESTLRLEGTIWEVTESCASGATDLVLLARLNSKYLTMSKQDKSICVLQEGNIQLVKKILPSET